MSAISKELLGNRRVDLFLFEVGFALWLFCRILLTSAYGYESSSLASIFRLGIYGGLFLCAFSELFTRGFTSRTLVLLAVLAALILLLARVGGNDLCFALFLAFSARRFRFRSLLQVGVVVTFVAVLVVVGSHAIGLIGQVYDNDRNRGSLGFGWVTFLSHYNLMLVIGYSILRQTRIRNAEIFILLAVSVFIFYKTGSRNSFVLAIAYICLMLVFKCFKHWNAGKVACGIAAISFPICALASWFLFVTINPYTLFGTGLNSFFSGRISLTQQALDLYGVNLFGSIVQWVTQSGIRSGAYASSQYLYVDCSYMNILINYGLVFFVVLMVGLAVVAYKATRRCGSIFGLAFVIFAVHGIVDPQLLDLHYCTFLLLLGGVFDPSPAWDKRMFDLAPSTGDTPGPKAREPLATKLDRFTFHEMSSGSIEGYSDGQVKGCLFGLDDKGAR